MTVTLHFHGAAGTVTGSCYRVVHPKGQFLVDCGMFQGNKTVRDLNYKPLPFDPQANRLPAARPMPISTTAGLLPKLAQAGLPQADVDDRADRRPARIPAARRRRHPGERGRARDQEAQPPRRGAGRAALHDGGRQRGAEASRKAVEYEKWIEPGPGVRARYWNAGHILGSASIEVEVRTATARPIRILFSGDLGPDEKVFYEEPDAPGGLRLHPVANPPMAGASARTTRSSSAARR